MIEIISKILGGAFLGVVVTTVYNYFKEKRERKDKYYFSLLERRFETAQKAIALTEKLKSVIHERDWTKRTEVVNSVKDWYYDYCLYLSPAIRKEFRDVISDVSMYQAQLDDYHAIGRSTNQWDTVEMKKKKEEIDQTFKNIRSGIQKKIEEHIDIYYDYIDGKK